MGPIEEEIKRALDMAVKSTPVALAAATEGPQTVSDPVGDLVMPMLDAQREAILYIARTLDERA